MQNTVNNELKPALVQDLWHHWPPVFAKKENGLRFKSFQKLLLYVWDYGFNMVTYSVVISILFFCGCFKYNKYLQSSGWQGVFFSSLEPVKQLPDILLPPSGGMLYCNWTSITIISLVSCVPSWVTSVKKKFLQSPEWCSSAHFSVN